MTGPCALWMVQEVLPVVNECGPLPGWRSRREKCYVGFHMRSLERWTVSDLLIVDKPSGKECWIIRTLVDREMGDFFTRVSRRDKHSRCVSGSYTEHILWNGVTLVSISTYCFDTTNLFKVNLECQGHGFLSIYMQPNSSYGQLSISFFSWRFKNI